MAKIDKGLFERAGYSLGMSRLVKDMQYVDYTEKLKQELDKIGTYNKQKKEENPYGLPIEKIGRNERENSTQYIMQCADRIKELGRVTEGKNVVVDGETRKATKEDVESARNKMDELDLEIKNHSDHLETKAQLTANLRNRGISEAATFEQKTNYEAIQNNTQEQRFNEETNEYEWFDHTVGNFVPISKFNTGSAYNDTLEKTIDDTYKEVRQMAATLKYQKNPDNFKPMSVNLMSDIKTLVEKDPDAVKNLLFQKKNNPDFKNLLDVYMEKYYQQHVSTPEDAAEFESVTGIKSFEDYKNSNLYDAELNKFKQEGEIDNQLFLNSYESMINNEFEKYLPEPEPEEKKLVVKTKTKKEKQGDFTDDGDVESDDSEEEVTAFAPTKESVTKYILANLDKFSFEESTIEAIKKGERPFDTLVSYINDPNYKAK